MRKIAMMAAVAALASAPQLASAADLGGTMKDVPPPVMVTNWTGFYAGVGVGFGAVVSDYKFYDETLLFSGFLDYVHDDRTTGGDGVLGTVQVGYDYLFPASRWLVGAFADYDWENFGGSHDYACFNSSWNPFRNCFTPPGFFPLVNPHHNVTLRDQWNVGGRLGWLTNPDTLVYVLLAYSQAQEKAALDGYYDHWNTLLTDLRGTATLDGVTVGAGIETHLWSNWFLKLEYRFSQFSSDNAWERLFYPINATNEHIWGEVDADVHTARIGVTYKFARQGFVEPLK